MRGLWKIVNLKFFSGINQDYATQYNKFYISKIRIKNNWEHPSN